MKLRALFLFPLFVLFLAGCQLELPPVPLSATTPLDSPFTLGMGQSIAVDGEPAKIRLERWVDEQRCPSTLECAESGPVKVQITLWREGHAMAYPVFTVHTDRDGDVLVDAPGNDNEVKVGPYRITLTAVTPYPVDTQPAPARDYQATFIVGKDPTALLDTDADMNVITDTPFTLALGEQVSLVGREVALRVDRVTDGRCPIGVKCTDAGNGAVEVLLTWLEDGADPRPVRLSAYTDETGAVLPTVGPVLPFELVDGVGIRLLSVEPYPVAAEEVAQGDYRVKLMLEPGPRMPSGTEFAELGQAFSLTPDHTAVLGRDLLRIRFDAVIADSRCPRQVLCVHAGEVQVAITAANSQLRATTYLLGGATDEQGQLLEPATIDHDGFTVRLVQVTPYPEGPNASIAADVYAATFVVETQVMASVPGLAATPTPTTGETALLPLLCINDFAALRLAAGGADEPAILFTEPLTQDAATDYGQVHALCNKTFGAEWVHAGPPDPDKFALFLPANRDFWVWDGMAGSLVRYAP